MPLTNGDQQDQQGDVEFFDAEVAESFSAPSPPPRHDSITTNFLLQLNSTHRRNSTTTSSKNDKSSSSSLNDLRHRLRPHWNSKNKTCTTKKKTANSPQQRKRPTLQPSAVGFGPLCRPRRRPRHPLVSGEWNDIAEVIGMEDFNVSVSYVTESRSVTWLRPYSYAHFPPGPVRALLTI